MTDWFNSLDTQMQVYWGIAIFASVIFVLQTALSLFGIGGDGDADFDLGDASAEDSSFTQDAMHLLSLRNIVNFLLGLGWGGVCFRGSVENDVLLAVLAVIVGVLFVVVFLYLFKKMMKLEHNGAMDPVADVVGKTADVYLRIPADGKGKIQLSVNGSVYEFDAVAKHSIPTKAKVRVIEKKAQGTYLVEEI